MPRTAARYLPTGIGFAHLRRRNVLGTDNMTHAIERWLNGAAAGLAATLPMTAFMVAAHRLLPLHQRRELPPARIAGAVLRTAGLKSPAEATASATVLANHLAYGAAMGAIYRGVIHPQGEPTVPRGLAYGLGVWAGGYLGWLPLTDLHPSAVNEPRERNALMVLAHVVWGISFCASLRMIEELRRAQLDGENKTMSKASDRFTIIHSAHGRASQTMATGLTREQARQWLARKAEETGRTVSRDLTIEDASPPGDPSTGQRWQAVKAE